MPHMLYPLIVHLTMDIQTAPMCPLIMLLVQPSMVLNNNI
jgi:hypothetical protein